MLWSSSTNSERLLVRRIRNQILGIDDGLAELRADVLQFRDAAIAEITDIRQKLAVARAGIQELEARVAVLEAAQTPPNP